ncbi:MAG TPA: Ig-like domain-containing protein, partial [Kofleriaceae bacterium]|nr:Ig-like domain-containing protein [Kofleriaceae bacterium]
MKRTVFSKCVAWTTLSALVVSCGGNKTAPPPAASDDGSAKQGLALVKLDDAPDGMNLRVRDGKQGPPAYDRAKLAPAKKLSSQDADALLARAKPITKDTADQQPFALRPSSQPPPRTGQTITGQFPPDPSTLLPPVANDAGKPLEVLRFMPEGKVPIAPELSVTFSSPMVAVTSQDDAAATKPVKLTPEPKGRWRWLGTRTVIFDPEVRFPMATTYTVEVAAGTAATNGSKLAKPTKFTFETPPVTVVGRYPFDSGQPQHVDTPMFLLFDQKIDPQAVLAKLKVTANGKGFGLRLLSANEIVQDKDKELAAMTQAADKAEQAGRWLAFRATQPFPPDATVTIEVPAGTPSAEGPNPTTAAQSQSFRTYPPLRIDRAECGHQNKHCAPLQPFTISLNNPLDEDKFEDAMVTVSPDVPGLRVERSGGFIGISGATKARTTYKVTVSSKLPDEFGQTLGKDATFTWPVGDA